MVQQLINEALLYFQQKQRCRFARLVAGDKEIQNLKAVPCGK